MAEWLGRALQKLLQRFESARRLQKASEFSEAFFIESYLFLKAISFQKISKEGIRKIGNAIEILAEAEGLDAHKNAVTLRLKSMKSE